MTEPRNKSPYPRKIVNCGRRGQSAELADFIERLDRRPLEWLNKLRTKLQATRDHHCRGLPPGRMNVLHAVIAAIISKDIRTMPVEPRQVRFRR